MAQEEYNIVDDIEVPESAKRTRRRGAFAEALDSLEVGQGFEYESSTLKAQYARVAPKKFSGKRFKVWEKTNSVGDVIEGEFGVKRIE